MSASKASDAAAARRRLGEMTIKYEALQIKYSALRDLAGGDAQQSAFDRLKSATDAKMRTQDSLIASLRKEIQGLRSTDDVIRIKLQEAQEENSRLKAGTSELEVLRDEQRKLQARVIQLNAANVRARSDEPVSVAASTKGKGLANNKGKAADDTNHAVAIMKLKEDLYCDLTGLMIHSVKQVDGEDVFDCIQTGRNGSKF
jgi:Chromosome segregation protein Csm1/Pcs1